MNTHIYIANPKTNSSHHTHVENIYAEFNTEFINQQKQGHMDILDSICNPETIAEIPTKKKKGRKSNLDKMNELEKNKKNNIPNKFPPLNEKILDIIKLNGTEYYYDSDFNMLFDQDTNPVGFKCFDARLTGKTSQYVLYSGLLNDINQLKKDNKEVKKLLGMVEIYG